MRLQTKLIMAFLFLAMVPLASSYWRLTVDVYSKIAAQRDLFRSEQLDTLVQHLDWNLNHVATGLRMGVESFDTTQLSSEERQGVLRILFGQRSYLNAIQLLTWEGRPLGATVRLTDPDQATGAFADHVAIRNDELAVFQDAELIRRARENGISWGGPFEVEGGAQAQVPLILGIRQERRMGYLVAALLSANKAAGAHGALQSFAESAAQGRPVVYLMDSNGNLLLQAVAQGAMGANLDFPPLVTRLLQGGNSGQIETEVGVVTQVVAWQKLESTGWRVVTVQPAELVDESLRKPMKFVWYWSLVSVVIAVVYGFYFSRTLSRPIQRLAAGVLEVARGNLDARVAVQTRDEVGELAETFNYMAGELKSQKAEIERQSAEIRTWNRELQARVEERTRELKEAQGYLIHTQKLAAVAELGSGVAHELNNPLAAVLGFVQILIAQVQEATGEDLDPTRVVEILKRVEEQTQRCREIVQHLLRFSQEQVDRGSYDIVDVTEVVRTVFKLFEGAFLSQKIAVNDELGNKNLSTWGNRAQLLQAFLQIVSAVRAVLAREQRLVIRCERDEQSMSVVLSGPIAGLETGPLGIDDNRDQAMAQGLGLWVAREIIQEHQGGLRIELPEEADDADGARLIVTLPIRTRERVSDLAGAARETPEGELE